MKKILHICYPDKFTIPLYNHITYGLELENHKFLFVSKDLPDINLSAKNYFHLKEPNRRFFFRNIFIFLFEGLKARKIILHGAPLDYFFLLFPFLLKKTCWFIYGGMDLPIKKISYNWREKCHHIFLKSIPIHITHIEGDSEYANNFLGCKARFVYSPMYLSNTVSTDSFNSEGIHGKNKISVLVGNSTSPYNNHLEIFDLIKNQKNIIEKLLLPLSYGMYDEYKQKIIKKGVELFEDKFVALEKFINIEDYKEMLKNIDVAIFNHKRQEAMGVTILLLGLGKIVYMNSETTSFTSFINRGFKIFDNKNLIKESLLNPRSIEANQILVEEYYSVNVLNKCTKELENL